jgi:type I restriction enzyme S subunit
MSKEPTRFKQTEIGELPEEWEVIKVQEACDDISAEVAKVKKRECRSTGKYPVIDQGAEFISGYTDHEGACKDLPVIVFGDHTRIFKFVDFPFVRGADGVKVLRPKPNFHPRFLFYALSSLKIPTIGYQRHYSLLKEQFIPLPPLEEQKRIAGVLRLVDRVAEETRRIVSIYERAKRFALKRLLTRGIGHTRFKQTEIGELPEEWEVVRLEDVARVFSGSSAPQGREYFENGIFPFVRVQDLAHYGQTRCLTEVTDKVNERAVQEHHLVLARKGTILFPKSGAALEKNHRAILGVDAYIVSHLAAVEANPEKVDNEFLFWWLCCIDMASLNPNPGYPSIRLEEIKNLTIPLPPLEEQKQIAEMLGTIDAVIENERRYLGVLEKCKRWLLDNLLTGKIRLSPEVDEILKGVLPDAF